MNILKNLSKRSRGILGALAVVIVVTVILTEYLHNREVQKETYTVKNYENMAENNLANEVREYMKIYSDMEAENIDAVTDVAVKDYNIVLNSGIESVTDEHSAAVEESIKKTLLVLLPDTEAELSQEDIDYLSNGICQIIWNALMETLNSSDAALSKKYEEQYAAFTASLQKQIDELSERSTAISITANIKRNEDGINASDLEQAKSDIYGEMHSELDSMETRIREDVMENVNDGKDGRDGRDGTNGRDGINGKDGSNGKDGADGKDGVAGTNGQDGSDGKASYTYVRYAEDQYGSGMSERPNDKSYYIGVYSGASASAPDQATAYTWSQYRGNNGNDGQDGVDGEDGMDGANGTAAYMHVRYAEDQYGSGMSEQPNNETYYIGIYSGDSPAAPDTADAYVWSKYRGNDSASATYDADTNTVIFTIVK